MLIKKMQNSISYFRFPNGTHKLNEQSTASEQQLKRAVDSKRHRTPPTPSDECAFEVNTLERFAPQPSAPFSLKIV